MASRFIKYLRQTMPNKTNKENSIFYKFCKRECWAEDPLFFKHPQNRLFEGKRFNLKPSNPKYKLFYKQFIVNIAIRPHNNLNVLSKIERNLKNAQQD